MQKESEYRMKILVISLAGAGDVLMTTPFIRELRESYPKAKIECLVTQGEICKDLLKNNTDIDNVIYFKFMKQGFLNSLLFCKKLKKQKYDLSITTYPQAKIYYSVISYLIEAKKRVGFDYDSQRFKFNKIFFTNTIREDSLQHVVENNLKILDILGKKRKIKNPKLILNLKEEDIKFGRDYFKENKIEKAVIVHAGSGTTKNFILKRWPKERFAELCMRIAKKKYKIILVGGPEENDLKNWIIKFSGLKENEEIFNLKNEGINKESGVIKNSSIIICNDAVIGHIAAALGKEVVVLFGPTSWQNLHPFTDKKTIICKNEGIKLWRHGEKINKEQAESMKKIEVEDVYQIVDKILK